MLHSQIPRLLLHGLGGNRSVVSVDQCVLVDLIGRDVALGDDGDALGTKTLADKIPHLLGHGMWLDEHEGSSLAARAFNLQVRHPSVQRSDVRCWWYARLRGTTRQLRDALLWPGSCRHLAALCGKGCYHRHVPGKSPFGSLKPTRRSCASPCVASSAEAAKAPVTANCATRYAPWNGGFSWGAVGEAELSEFLASSCQAAHSSYRAGELTRVSGSPSFPCNHKNTARANAINLETAGG